MERRKKFIIYFESLRNGDRTAFKDDVVLFDEKKNCSGCGACADACPVHAITMEYREDGCYPKINTSKCVKCKKCLKVCGQKSNAIAYDDKLQAFIGHSGCLEDVAESASGSVFYEIAKSIIAANGIVYGATLVYEKNRVLCKHIGIEHLSELSKLRNSKYVQSLTVGIFSDVKKQVDSGRLVLFSGTSCQVASLYSFLGKKHYDNLLTIDLICHGVPSQKVFDDYISYLGALYHGKITNFSFRSKNRSLGWAVPYIMSMTVERESEKKIDYHIGLRNSAYYRMFMACGGYRESCYHCHFAGLNKLADITLGDYYVKEASDEVRSLGLSEQILYSCIIVRSEYGANWINNACVSLHPIRVDTAVHDHPALQRPSARTGDGEKLYSMYKKDGFAKMQKYIDRKNKIIDIIKSFYRKRRK